MTRQGHKTSATASDLAAAIVQFHHGLLPASRFSAIFLRSTVYCERRNRGTVVAAGRAGTGYVLAFTSELELARYWSRFPDRRPDDGAWISTTGEDLVGLLPDGYGIALDVAGATPVALPASAMGRVLVIRARARERAGAVSS